jgi:hypothetical protein
MTSVHEQRQEWARVQFDEAAGGASEWLFEVP